MKLIVVVAPPGGGGNHLSNVLRLSENISNRHDYETIRTQYYKRCYGGENPKTFHFWEDNHLALDELVKKIQLQDTPYVICIHADNKHVFSRLTSIQDRKYILLRLPTNNLAAIKRIDSHSSHIFQDQTLFYNKEFLKSDDVLEVEFDDYFTEDISALTVRINEFANLNIDVSRANSLHWLWWNKGAF